MSDRFLSALKVVERQRSEEFTFDVTAYTRLEQLTQSMSDEWISDNDYLKLLELYYKKYVEDVNRSNMLYCLLRMQQICQAKSYKFFRSRFHRVEFQSHMEEDIVVFLSQKKPYLRQMKHRAMIPLLWVSLVLYGVGLALMVYVAQFSFCVSMIVSLLVWVCCLVYSYFFVAEMLMDDQLNRMVEKLDFALIDFEKKRACDSFKLFHKLNK